MTAVPRQPLRRRLHTALVALSLLSGTVGVALTLVADPPHETPDAEVVELHVGHP